MENFKKTIEFPEAHVVTFKPMNSRVGGVMRIEMEADFTFLFGESGLALACFLRGNIESWRAESEAKYLANMQAKDKVDLDLMRHDMENLKASLPGGVDVTTHS